MNNLSWIIYWADVAPSVSSAIAWLSFFLTLGFLAVWITGLVNTDLNEEQTRSLKKLVWVWPFTLVLYVTSFLVPGDKETYYAIAASEVGEEILKTPEIGKARQALNNWLNKQIEEEAPKKETAE